MRRIQQFLLAAPLLSAPAIAGAQVPIRTLSTASTTLTNDQLTARLIALEARVAQLESMLYLVSGQLVLDGKGAPVFVKGSTVTIKPDGELTLLSGGNLRLAASSQLDLRGSTVVLNGGTKHVTCEGAFTTIVAARLDHQHQVTGQGCGTSVLVP